MISWIQEKLPRTVLGSWNGSISERSDVGTSKRLESDINSGFTLVELLVVISIIGLLSSVVLAAVNSARIKAQDAQIASTIHQYILAVQLAYDADNAFTLPSTSSGSACLGLYPLNTCGFFDMNQKDDQLNSKLLPYISLPPLPTIYSPSIPALYFKGAIYTCSIQYAGKCVQVDLMWATNSGKCTEGAIAAPVYMPDLIQCILTIK